MKNTFKKLFKFALIAPFLMAFQCDDDVESDLVFNEFKSEVTAQATFSLDDTVWISGRLSSNIFDRAINDSIFITDPSRDTFSVYKFMTPTSNANCKDAIDTFDIISDIGQVSFLGACENAQLQVSPVLNDDNTSYNYRIGLKTLEPGDYVVSWDNEGVLQNSERNVGIVDNYLIEGSPNDLGFDRCGIVSSRLFTESQKEYYFSVQ